MRKQVFRAVLIFTVLFAASAAKAADPSFLLQPSGFYDFGDVATGKIVQAKITITLTSRGTRYGLLKLESPFSCVGSTTECGYVLNLNKSKVFTIQFVPTASGIVTSPVRMENNAENISYNVLAGFVGGNGITADTPPAGATTPANNVAPPAGGTVLRENNCPPGTPAGTICLPNPLSVSTFDALLNKIIDFIFWVGITVAPVIFIIAGFLFVTSAGDAKKLETAKHMMLYTVIGLVVLLFARGLVAVLKSVIGVQVQ